MLTKTDIEKYMKEGENAYTSGSTYNPYSKFSERGRLWLRGYSNSKWSKDMVKAHG